MHSQLLSWPIHCNCSWQSRLLLCSAELLRIMCRTWGLKGLPRTSACRRVHRRSLSDLLDDDHQQISCKAGCLCLRFCVLPLSVLQSCFSIYHVARTVTINGQHSAPYASLPVDIDYLHQSGINWCQILRLKCMGARYQVVYS